MGGPEYKHGGAYNAGTATGTLDGAWPRGADQVVSSTFANRIRDYCLKGDWMCRRASGPRQGRPSTTPVTPPAMTRRMATWVLGKL